MFESTCGLLASECTQQDSAWTRSDNLKCLTCYPPQSVDIMDLPATRCTSLEHILFNNLFISPFCIGDLQLSCMDGSILTWCILHAEKITCRQMHCQHTLEADHKLWLCQVRSHLRYLLAVFPLQLALLLHFQQRSHVLLCRSALLPLRS